MKANLGFVERYELNLWLGDTFLARGFPYKKSDDHRSWKLVVALQTKY